MNSMATGSTPLAVVGTNQAIVSQRGGIGIGAGARRVLITPLTLNFEGLQTVIEKVHLKAVTKGTSKKKEKVFTLRRIETSKVVSCTELKKLIHQQLSGDIINWEKFDVGYISLSNRSEKVITIRTKEDLTEVWKDIIKQGDRVQLWCDGL